MSLLSEERKEFILSEIDINGKVQVADLAEKLNVSGETIRRDLETLENEGKVKRVYGGAIKQSYAQGEPPFLKREEIHRGEKEAVGKKAATIIQDGDTIFLDSGTTTIETAKALTGLKGIVIITNSIPVINVLRSSLSQKLIQGKLIMLGGEYSSDQQSVSGDLCEEMLQNFYVDKAFLSVGGVSIHSGISDYDLNESKISKLMTLHSKEVIVLADHSKIGVQSFRTISTLDHVDVIISDKEFPQTWGTELKTRNVEWIVADY